ncbi:ATP-grasp domain-containing protein [Sinorhizobium meliloti]|nr:ATP-grasp domain-containing protein [Sinorhizobium meliloti]
MATKALILVEGHQENGPLYVQAAHRLGLHPITLAANPAEYDYLAAESVEVIRVNTDNLAALIRECDRLRATYDIAGITGFPGLDESIYVTVASLCQYFKLPGPNPESVEKCYNKFAQRQLLAQAGVPVPAYRVAASSADVESAAADIGLPVVIKPVVGSGSSGVRLCRTVDEVTEHAGHLLGGAHIWRCSPMILVEEFAQGPYYGANIMGNDVVGIAAADFGPPPHFVFRETIFPAPLTDSENKLIADVSLSCLQALGLGWGPTNIELRWTTRGPVIIEVNPRLSGGTAPRRIQLAYGIDLVTEHVKLVVGEKCDLRRRQANFAASRNLVPDRDGTLDWIHGGSQAAAIPGIAEVKFVKPGTSVVRRGDYTDTLGHVIAASPDLTQAKAALQLAVDVISWSITPFPSEQE